MIQTVKGKINKEELGITSAHEHYFIDLSKIKNDPDTILNDFELTQRELKFFYYAGGRSAIEFTNEGMGRNVLKLKKLSEKTNVHLITCTGFYKDPFIPKYALEWNRDDFAKHFIEEIKCGIDDTGVFPGVIGEIGTSKDEIKPIEKELLLGAGMAAKETGYTISTHTTLGTMGIEQVEMLFGLGLSREQIIIGHQDLNTDQEAVSEVLKSGVYIGFDTIGKNNYRDDRERIEFITEFMGCGFENQIVLSADLTRQSHLKTNGGPGYAVVLNDFVPKLRESGVTELQISKMLKYNPANAIEIKENKE